MALAKAGQAAAGWQCAAALLCCKLASHARLMAYPPTPVPLHPRHPPHTLQGLEQARLRLLGDPGASPAGVLGELQAELASADVAGSMASATKELHGAVSKLGKVRRGAAGGQCARVRGRLRWRAWHGIYL